MKKVLMYGAIGIVVLAAIGALAESGDQSESAATDVTDQQSEPPETAPSPPPEPEPEGDFALASCNLDLGDISADNYQLVGSTEVINTGEVAARVKVSFRWQLGDGTWIKARPKRVQLQTGAEKLVFFKEPVSQDVGSSFQDHPGYFEGDNCKTNVVIR